MRLLVDAARHATAAEAGRALDAARTMHRERNLPVADAPELGEGGFVSREGGRAGAKYQVGPYSGQVNLSAGEAAASDREARAASAVAAELRRRLGPDAAGP